MTDPVEAEPSLRRRAWAFARRREGLLWTLAGGLGFLALLHGEIESLGDAVMVFAAGGFVALLSYLRWWVVDYQTRRAFEREAAERAERRRPRLNLDSID